MIVTSIKRIEWFIMLVLLQVLILNNMHIAGYATPFLYVYLILTFNSAVSRNELMLWAFFLGLSVDMFSNTPGVNAATTVALAFTRPFILRLFSSRDNFEDFIPSSKTIGISPFVKYVITGVLLQTSVLLLIESFSLFNLPVLLLKIVSSTLLTVLCIIAIEGIRR